MTIKTGEQMLASDVLNLAFFPKGMILMYDGTSWQNNITLKGWYKCDGNGGAAVNGLAIPNLQNKFIMGYSSGARTGGSNSRTLTANQIPSHTHGFTTSTKELVGEFNPGANFMTISATGIFSSWGNSSDERGGNSSGGRIKIDATHSHTGTTNNQDGKTNGTNVESFDNRPEFYALIYIIKVTDTGRDSF